MQGKSKVSLLIVLMMFFSIFMQPLAILAVANESEELLVDAVETEVGLSDQVLDESDFQTEDEQMGVEISDEQAETSAEEIVEQDVELEEESVSEVISSTVAPQDYQLDYNETDLVTQSQMFSRKRVDEQKRVLLIEDVRPWDTNTNDRVLAGITKYDKVTTSQFLSVNLADYAVIVFANDQPFHTYENYTDFRAHMETFASLGGVIVFGAADGGWAEGNLIEDLPGGVSKQSQPAYQNYVSDDLHPIVSGSLTNNHVLVDSDLYENYVSHISFVEDSLPVGTRVILRESKTDQPTLIEYPLEKGRVIASGLTWEYNYVHGGKIHPEGGRRGKFAQTAMKDMFEYAIRVSNISVDDVKVLEELYVETNQHHIVVVSKETAEVLSNAEVQIGNAEADLTDDKGMVSYFDHSGRQLVTVSKEGYRTTQLEYPLNHRMTRFIFLEKDRGDGKPYFIRVQDQESTKDLRVEPVRFTEGDRTPLRLKVAGNWGEHRVGSYQLYQEGEAGGKRGLRLISFTGEFVFMPGMQFNPDQPVKLKMDSGNGIASDPITLNLFIDQKPKVNVENNGGGLENIQGFSIADEQQGSVTDEKVYSIFPGDYSLKAPFVPIELERSVENNGTVTWRGTIGIGGENLMESDSKWNTFKDDIKEAEKNVGGVADLERIMSRTNPHLDSFIIEQQLLNLKTEMIGYIEIVQDKDGNMIQNEGAISMMGSNESVFTKQFLYGPIPLYIDLTGKIELSTTVGLGYDYDNGKFFYNSNDFVITPGIAVGAGVGVSGLATLGAEGGAELEIGIHPDFQGSVTTEAKLKAQLLFIGEWEYTLATATFELWGHNRMKMMRMAQQNHEVAETEMALVSRDYTEKTSDWHNIDNREIRLFNLRPTADWLTLQEWIMPNTLPQLAEVDGTQVMLFQADDQEKPNGDHTLLMYSVYQDGLWSNPLPVWESDTSDFYYQTLEHNDELYLIWQKSKAQVTATDVTDLLVEVSENSEISFAKWNKATSAFDEQQFLTDNGVLDMYASLAANGEDLTAVWVSNSESDPFGEIGTYSIMKSTLTDGNWSLPTVIHQTTDYITELATEYVDGDLTIAYSVQTNDGYSDLYVIEADQIKQLTQGDRARAIQLHDQKLYWHSDGRVIVYDLINRTRNQISVGEEQEITSSYQVIEVDNQTAIVWHDGLEAQSTVYASFAQGDEWTEPISLFVSEDFTINYLDVKRVNDEWMMIINALEHETEDDKHLLIFVHQNIKADTVLNGVYANERLRVNGNQPIEFSVTNLGESDVDSLTIQLENGEQKFEKNIELRIQPGETVFITEDFDVSAVLTETNFAVSVFTNRESDFANNVDQLTLGQTNITMDINHYRLENQIVVTATVANQSEVPTDVAIKLIEDSVDGIVLDMKNIGRLDQGKDYIYTYLIDLDHVDFNQADSKYYYFDIETSETNLNQSDASDLLVIYKDQEIAISDQPIENIEMIHVTGVEIDQNQVSIGLNESTQLDAEVKPANATIPNLRWQTEDARVAIVDQTGLVTAIGTGKTNITATTYDGEFVASVEVTVSGEGEDDDVTPIIPEGPSQPVQPGDEVEDKDEEQIEPEVSEPIDDQDEDEVPVVNDEETTEETVAETEEKSEDETVIVSDDEVKTESDDDSQTLANTATYIYNFLMAGLLFVLLGSVLYWLDNKRNRLEN